MKESEGPLEPAGAAESHSQDTASRRITLALLDELSSLHEDKGHDPYNTNAGSTAQDLWRHKRKRR